MNTDRVVGVAQIALSVVFLVGYFCVLGMFLLGHVYVAPVWRDQLGVMLGVLTAGVMLVLQFWFSRSRPQDAKA
jgi:hypothetical protein